MNRDCVETYQSRPVLILVNSGETEMMEFASLSHGSQSRPLSFNACLRYAHLSVGVSIWSPGMYSVIWYDHNLNASTPTAAMRVT